MLPPTAYPHDHAHCFLAPCVAQKASSSRTAVASARVALGPVAYGLVASNQVRCGCLLRLGLLQPRPAEPGFLVVAAGVPTMHSPGWTMCSAFIGLESYSQTGLPRAAVRLSMWASVL